MRVFVHPEEPDAWKQYDQAYGNLFRNCPGFKGVILVGKSIGFPTRDPIAAPFPFYKNTADDIPTGKPSADLWPCSDYKDWIELLKKVIFAEKPDADIVFWTYNWGHAPKENRLQLIRSLPKDISLLVTYETFHKYKIGNTVGYCSDYTLSFEGPGEYFTSEAEAAKECGIRLYAMTNTGGMTWDMGMIPYEPMPYQWRKRYESIQESHDKWDLCGLMDSHHYGYWPSFIGEIAKEAFEDGGEDYDTALHHALLRGYGKNAAAAVDEALKLWSEAISFYISSNENQYGAFRIVPAYPFNLSVSMKHEIPYPSTVDFSFPKYYQDNAGKGSLSSVRIREEKQSLERMLQLLCDGQKILEAISDPNEELEYLVNLGRFLVCNVTTGIHAMEWHICASYLLIESDEEKVGARIDEAERILQAEYENVENAIPCVQKDSRLGWEPYQEYRCSPKQLEWKLRQLNYVRNTELKMFRNSLSMTMEEHSVVGDHFVILS